MNNILKDAILALTRYLPDELYLRIAYRIVTGKVLHLNPPITYNEKLQWLKLHNHQQLYIRMVDKYDVRDYITERVGDCYLVPTLGIWNSIGDIDWNLLPNQFVLKCTHDSGGVIICKDKSTFNKQAAIEKLSICLKRNFYYQGREWPYKYVKPRIYAEAYLSDENDDQLTDYKVFCFDGEPKLIQIDYDRFNGHKRQFFDTQWNRLDISFHFPSDSTKQIPRPEPLAQILDLAKLLSAGLPHLRTDFYCIGNKIYVGEMTFFHGTGFGKWSPDSFDKEMGEWLNIDEL